MSSQIPLNAAASNGVNNSQVTNSLPPEVVQCLENARFVRPHRCVTPPYPFFGACPNDNSDSSKD